MPEENGEFLEVWGVINRSQHKSVFLAQVNYQLGCDQRQHAFLTRHKMDCAMMGAVDGNPVPKVCSHDTQ